MTVFYPNLCYNEVSYKGTALYMLDNICSFARKPVVKTLDQVRASNQPAQLHRMSRTLKTWM